MAQSSQIFRWAATVSRRESPFTDVHMREWLTANCKKWAFQGEIGDGGYKHWQVAMNLKKRMRLTELVKAAAGGPMAGAHFSIMHDEEKGGEYVMKEETRVEGPWSSSDCEEPDDIKGKAPLPWQTFVINDCKSKCNADNLRKANVIVDIKGGMGKSTLKKMMRYRKIAQIIPWSSNKVEDVMAMVMCMPKSNAYVLDVPRKVEKKSISNLWNIVESIKDGHAYDKRHVYKEKLLSTPKVWVFMNEMPNLSGLSPDKWKIYLSYNGELIPYNEARLAKIRKLVEAEPKAIQESIESKEPHPFDNL